MKLTYVNSLGLPKGFRVKEYETIAEIVKDAGSETAVVEAVNKYLRQKSALVAGRDDLAGLIEETYAFKPILKTIKKDGKDVEVWDETEGKYIERFIASVVSGKFTAKGLTLTGNDEQKEAAIYAELQKLADKCGDVDKDGKPLSEPAAYVLDIRTPERSSKPKKLPQYAIDGATNIINNKAEAKWVKRWTEGYTNSNSVKIDPLSFDSFVAKAPANATPEQVETVRQQNIKNLAAAIVADREQVLAKTAKQEYA